MSRAFVDEDAASEPDPRYTLPPRDSVHYERAAALALIEGANIGNTRSAEAATGYRWGDPVLATHMEEIRDRAVEAGDDRTEQLAGRYLRKAAE